jgi:hypothetical protein
MDERVLTAAEVLGRRFGLLMGKALRKPVSLGALVSALARLFPSLDVDEVAAPQSEVAAASFAGFIAG